MRKLLLSMPFSRWIKRGEVKYNLSKITWQLGDREFELNFCDSRAYTLNHCAHSHGSMNRHLLCYISFDVLPALASSGAMSPSSWHSLWYGCWMGWHLALDPFKTTLRRTETLFYLSVLIWRGSQNLWVLTEISLRSSSQSRQVFWFRITKKLLCSFSPQSEFKF